MWGALRGERRGASQSLLGSVGVERFALAVGLLVAVVPRVAHAESECGGDKPWVAVSGQVAAGFAHAVRSDLRAGLAPSSIEVCEAGSTEPLARVVLRQVDGARYSLDVTDSVTKKRLGRDLSLEKLPADGRALALAVAAEELLRASWAELALRGVHSAQTAAPPEVQAVVEKSAPLPTPPRRYTALGARLVSLNPIRETLEQFFVKQVSSPEARAPRGGGGTAS